MELRFDYPVAAAAAVIAVACGTNALSAPAICAGAVVLCVALVTKAVEYKGRACGLGDRLRLVVGITRGGLHVHVLGVTIVKQAALEELVCSMLPLPFQLQKLSFGRVGICFVPCPPSLEILLDGLDLRLRVADPDDWDMDALFRNGQLLVAQQMPLALAALALEEERLTAVHGPPSLAARVVDAIMDKVAVRLPGLKLNLETRLATPTTNFTTIFISWKLLHMSHASPGDPDRSGNARWLREGVVQDFAIAGWLSEDGANPDGERHGLLPIPRMTVSVHGPHWVDRGLPGQRCLPTRAIKLHAKVECGVWHLTPFFTRAGRSLLMRYGEATEWWQRYLAVPASSGRILTTAERTAVLRALRPLRLECASPPAVSKSAVLTTHLSKGFACADMLALQWQASYGAESLGFDAHDDASWHAGSVKLWQRAHGALMNSIRYVRPRFNEQEIVADVEHSMIHREHVLFEGRSVRLHGLMGPTSMQVQYTAETFNNYVTEGGVRKFLASVEERAETFHSERSGTGIDDSAPLFDMTYEVGADGVMKVNFNTKSLRVCNQPALMNKSFPALSGLAVPDVNPTLPEVVVEGVTQPSQLLKPPEPTAALEPMGIMQGMPLELHCRFTDCMFLLPESAETDLQDKGGLEGSTTNFVLDWLSSPHGETLHTVLRGLALHTSDGEELLEPLSEDVDICTTVEWKPSIGPHTTFSFTAPYLKFGVSPAVVLVCNTVMEPRESQDGDPEVESVPVEAHNTNQMLLRLRSFFDSGSSECVQDKLSRAEIFKLVSSLCTGRFVLTQGELSAAFEDLWGRMNASENVVSFEEFCRCVERLRALSGTITQNTKLRSSGALALPAQDLVSTNVTRQIGVSEDAFWAHLGAEVDIDPEKVRDMTSRDFQWKLVRALRNYEVAQRWWSVVAVQLALDTPWLLSPDTPYMQPAEVMAVAIAEHLGVERGDQDAWKSPTSSSPCIRRGTEISVRMAGVEFALGDALSLLRGRYRIRCGAQPAEQDDPDTPALSMYINYWHDDDVPYLDASDSLDGHVRLRGVYANCLNPFHPQPEPFVEPFGIDMEASSEPGCKPASFQIVSDQHLVVNLSSSLLLAMKPMLNTFYPSQKSKAVVDSTFEVCTAPLDRLLHALGVVREKELEMFGLKLDIGVGTHDVPGETSYEAQSAKVRRHVHQVTLSLPSNLALVRIEISDQWQVKSIQLQSSVIQVQVEQENRTADEVPAVAVFVVNRLYHMRSDRHVSGFCTALNLANQNSVDLNVKNSLCLVNLCGFDANFWWDSPWNMNEFGTVPHTNLTHGTSVCTQTASKNNTLALVLDIDDEGLDSFAGTNASSVSCVIRPDLSTIGQYGVYVQSGPERQKDNSFTQSSRILYRGGSMVSNPSAFSFRQVSQPERDVQDTFVCTELSVDQRGRARLDLLPPLELKNGTQYPLHLRFMAPHSTGEENKEVWLEPSESYHVPVPMLRGPSWTVLASGVSAHAFVLNPSLLILGRREAQMRRALSLSMETHVLPPLPSSTAKSTARLTRQGSGDTKPQKSKEMRRKVLLLLPDLRVVNALPVTLTIAVTSEEGCLPSDLRTLVPGAITDFGMVADGIQLSISSGEEETAFHAPAGAFAGSKRFREISTDLNLGSLQFSVQCSWASGCAPEIVLCAGHVVFNKTGVPLKVCTEGSPHQELDEPAVLRAGSGDIKVGLAHLANTDIQEPLAIEHSGALLLRCVREGSGFVWAECGAWLKDDVLTLTTSGRMRWRLSEHTDVSVADVLLGAEHVICLKDPEARDLVLRAPSAEGFAEWLRQFRLVVGTCQARSPASTLKVGWNADLHGVCRCMPVPPALFGAWSKPVPVGGPGTGEAVVESVSGDSCVFFGVHVQPMAGALASTTSVTLAPRFVVRNGTNSLIQVLPSMLPRGNTEVLPPMHAPLTRMAKILEKCFATSCNEKNAVWVRPNESVVLTSFTPTDDRKIDGGGRRAVALRFAGQATLEMVSVSKKKVLPIDCVGDDFQPFKNNRCHFGPLPYTLRALVQEGRLRCRRSKEEDCWNSGPMMLTADADVFVGVREDCVKTWQQAEWTALNHAVDLRLRGKVVAKLVMFSSRVLAGVPLDVSAAGPGSVLLLAHVPRVTYEGFTTQGEATDIGLPWSSWVSLDTEGEDLVSLVGGDRHGPGGDLKFLRCTTQVVDGTEFVLLKEEQPPYRVENCSPSRTLALRFQGHRGLHILPPLSWCSFDWPVRHARKRFLLIEDVDTQNQALYDVSAEGADAPLDFRAEKRITAQTAELTEDGYHELLQTADTAEMAKFVQRVARELGGGTIDKGSLRGFAKWYSGEESSQTLRCMRDGLIKQGLIQMPKCDVSEEGLRKSLVCDSMMCNFVQTLLAQGGLKAEDDAELAGFVEWYTTRPALRRMTEELVDKEWVFPVRSPEEAYGAGRLSQAGIQLCLLRELPTGSETLAAAFAAARASENGKKPWKKLVLEARALMADKDDSVKSPDDAGLLVRETSCCDVAVGLDMEEKAGELSPEEKGFTSTENGEVEIDAAEFEDWPVDQQCQEGSSDDQRVLAMSEPLTQQGYEKVASLFSTEAMMVFIRRVVAEESGEIVNLDALLAFSRWYSGEHGVQTLARLREDLLVQTWVRFDSGRSFKLFASHWYDGSTKVLSLKEGTRGHKWTGIDSFSLDNCTLEYLDLDLQLAGAQLCVVVQTQVNALGCIQDTSLASQDEEVASITLDHLQVRKESKLRKVELRLHHFQVDNLRRRDRHNPIVLAPKDSGYHGKHETATSLLYISAERVPSSILHLRKLEVALQPLKVRIDTGFWFHVSLWCFAWLPEIDDDLSDTEVTALCLKELAETMDVPESTGTQFVFAESLNIAPLNVEVELIIAPADATEVGDGHNEIVGDSQFVIEDFADDLHHWRRLSVPARWLSRASHQIKGQTGVLQRGVAGVQTTLSMVMLGVGKGALAGAGHIEPRLAFPDLLMENEFGDLFPLLNRITQNYTKSALRQWWRVVLSTNILGDPIGLGASVSGSVVQFFRTVGAEFVAGDLRGEGMKPLAQGIVGGTFGHAGKFFGAVGDTFDGLRGKKAGGKALAPVSGLFHGAQHVATGVQRLLKEQSAIQPRRMGRITELRGFLLADPLRPIPPCSFSPRTTIFIERLRWPEDHLAGATYCVELRTMSSENKEIWKRRTRIGRVTYGGVFYGEVKWIPTHALRDSHLEIRIRDLALNGRVLYTGSVDPLPHVSKLLVNPTPGSLTHRFRASECVTVEMSAEVRRSTETTEVAHESLDAIRLPEAALGVKFWPAWDPLTVAASQRFHERPAPTSPEAAASPVAAAVPAPREGWFEKRSIGVINRWSSKWVVVEDGKFKYWDDKRQYDDGREAKVQVLLSRPQCPYRFAPSQIQNQILQIQVNGELSARWRLAKTEPESRSSWMRTILEHSVASE